MPEFTLFLDKNSPIPLYHQLKSLILKEIELGTWTSDQLIPTELAFSEHFQLSRTTVRQAITDLVKSDVLYRKKGVGTFVTPKKIEVQCLNSIVSIFTQMQSVGLNPSVNVLERSVLTPHMEILAEMGLPSGSQVIKLTRIYVVNSEPVASVVSYLPHASCGFILEEDLNNRSLYMLLAQYAKTNILHVQRLIEAKLTDAQDKKLLKIRGQCPIQSVVTKAYNHQDQIVEYNIAHFRGDRNKFVIEDRLQQGLLYHR